MQASIEQILSSYNDRAPLSDASTIPGALVRRSAHCRTRAPQRFQQDLATGGRTDQVQKPGEFVATRLAGEPIVVVRGT